MEKEFAAIADKIGVEQRPAPRADGRFPLLERASRFSEPPRVKHPGARGCSSSLMNSLCFVNPQQPLPTSTVSGLLRDFLSASFACTRKKGIPAGSGRNAMSTKESAEE